jgi:ABC-type antimicrobial peptide transport system permease subunit
MVSRPVYVNYKKAALDSQRQMLKLTNCLSMVGGSLRVLQLLALFVIYIDRARNHALLVIGSYELLGIPTF